MGKLITNERLSHAGHHAAGSVLRDHQNMLKLSGTKTTLQCKYIGTVNEDEQLRTTTQVKFHWIVGEDTSAPLEQTTFPGKILHCNPKPKAPRQLKVRLVCQLLPEAIADRRLVPAMQKVADGTQIRCRALALAKEHDAEYETTFLSMRNKRVEHVKLAHVSGKKWLVHPGTVLSISEIFAATIEEPTVKKKKDVIAEHLEAIPKCEQLSKLFAVACFQAESLRAKAESRAMDIVIGEQMFDKDTSKWTRLPKQVFVLWSSITSDGIEEHHATEVMFSTLFNGRL